MKLKSLCIAVAVVLSTWAVSAQAAESARVVQPTLQAKQVQMVPTGKGFGVPVLATQTGELSARRGKGNGIYYHNGPVMLGTVNVYYIWYGNWSGNSAVNIQQHRRLPVLQHQHHLL